MFFICAFSYLLKISKSKFMINKKYRYLCVYHMSSTVYLKNVVRVVYIEVCSSVVVVVYVCILYMFSFAFYFIGI